jgi:hypothetical protein
MGAIPTTSSRSVKREVRVNVTSLADMETLFDGIAVGDITTSMTINSPAAMIFAMYLAVAEQQGADWAKLSGTIQNDIQRVHRAEGISFLRGPSMAHHRHLRLLRARFRRGTPSPSADTTSAKRRDCGAELAFVARRNRVRSVWC